MTDVDVMPFVKFIYYFFDRYNLADLIFLYLLLQVFFFFGIFKYNEGLSLSALDSSNRAWHDQLFLKPLYTIVFVFLHIFVSGFYVIFFAICYWGLIQWIPDIWKFLFLKLIEVPEFNSALVIGDGIVLISVAHYFNYSVNRNLEIDSLNNRS
jgi:hypothetical protein